MSVISITWSIAVVIIDLTLPPNVTGPEYINLFNFRTVYFWKEIGFHLASIPFQMYFLYYSKQILSEVQAIHNHRNRGDDEESNNELKELKPKESKLTPSVEAK